MHHLLASRRYDTTYTLNTQHALEEKAFELVHSLYEIHCRFLFHSISHSLVCDDDRCSCLLSDLLKVHCSMGLQPFIRSALRTHWPANLVRDVSLHLLHVANRWTKQFYRSCRRAEGWATSAGRILHAALATTIVSIAPISLTCKERADIYI